MKFIVDELPEILSKEGQEACGTHTNCLFEKIAPLEAKCMCEINHCVCALFRNQQCPYLQELKLR